MRRMYNNAWGSVLGILVLGAFVTVARGAEPVEQQNSPRFDYLPIGIEGGAFVRSGSPAYLMGPWFSGERPSPGVDGGHRVYSDPLDRDLLQEFGCNAAAPFGAFSVLPSAETVPEVPVQALTAQLASVLARLRGVPLVVVLAAAPGPLSAGSRSAPLMLEPLDEEGMGQAEAEDAFALPSLMPDNVRDAIAARVQLFTAVGGNPWIYCRITDRLSKFPADLNQVETLHRWLVRRYRTIDGANRAWGTQLVSFADAVNTLQGPVASERGPLFDSRIFRSLLASRLQRAFREAVQQTEVRSSGNYTTWWDAGSMQPNAPVGLAAADSRSDIVPVSSRGLLGGTEYGRLRATATLAVARACASRKSPRAVLDVGFGSAWPGDPERPLRLGEVESCLWTTVFMGAGGALLCDWDDPPAVLSSAGSIDLPGHGEGSLFLDPSRCPPNVLRGLQRFRSEVDRLASIVLPRQVAAADIAILLPEDLSDVDGQGVDDGLTEVLAVFDALRRLRFPVEFILGSQIGGPADLRPYEVVFAPGLGRCSAGLGRDLGEYVRAGGVLAVGPGAMGADEYGRPTPAVSFLGLRFSPSPGSAPNSLVLAGDAPVAEVKGLFRPACSAAPEGANPIALWAGTDVPAAFGKQVGQGHTYTMLFHATGADLASFLAVLLRGEGVRRAFDFRSVPDGVPAAGVTVDRIERDGRRVYLLVNWGVSPVFGRLTIMDVRAGRWHVVDAVRWQGMLSPTEHGEWRASELSAGIEVLLPPGERALVLLSPAAVPGLMGEVSQESTRSRAKVLLARGGGVDKEGAGPAALGGKRPEGESHEEAVGEAAEAKGQTVAESAAAAGTAPQPSAEEGKAKRPAVDHSPIRQIGLDARFVFTVDLRGHVNRPFRDRTAGDGRGGWTDEGSRRDMRGLPLGVQTFGGVPYDVIDPDENGAKSCIVLAADDGRGVPDRVEDIRVERLAAELLFLHAAATPEPATPFAYRIRYRDGSVLDVPVSVGRTCGVWDDVQSQVLETDTACLAYASEGDRGSTGLFTYRWRNPRPDVPIRTLDVVTKSSGQALVVAISGTTPGLSGTEEETTACRVVSGAMVKPGWRLVPEGGSRLETEVGEDGQLEFGVVSPRGGRSRFRIEKERGAPSVEVPGQEWELQFGLRFGLGGEEAIRFRPEVRVGVRREGRSAGASHRAEVQQDVDLAMWQAVRLPVDGPLAVEGLRIEVRAVPAGVTCWVRNVWFVPSQ